MNRGPYIRKAGGQLDGTARPSVVLVENLSAYRVLRRMTQEELAARMTELGHEMTRSTVSAIEGLDRNVSVDEMFSLAICVGVTVGRLLDPTGPDHSRSVGLDVGLKSADGKPNPLSARMGYLWAASRVIVKVSDDAHDIEIVPAEELPGPAQRELDRLTRFEGD